MKKESLGRMRGGVSKGGEMRMVQAKSLPAQDIVPGQGDSCRAKKNHVGCIDSIDMAKATVPVASLERPRLWLLRASPSRNLSHLLHLASSTPHKDSTPYYRHAARQRQGTKDCWIYLD